MSTSISEITPYKEYKDLPDTTTPLWAEDINEIQVKARGEIEEKKQSLLERITALSGKVDGLVNYSMEERVVGKWIDNKPLYSKTICINSLSNQTGKTMYDNNISNAKIVWIDEQNTFVEFADGNTAPLPFLNPAVITNSVGNTSIAISDVGLTQFGISVGVDRSTVKAYVTLRYTKTTDEVEVSE